MSLQPTSTSEPYTHTTPSTLTAHYYHTSTLHAPTLHPQDTLHYTHSTTAPYTHSSPTLHSRLTHSTLTDSTLPLHPFSDSLVGCGDTPTTYYIISPFMIFHVEDAVSLLNPESPQYEGLGQSGDRGVSLIPRMRFRLRLGFRLGFRWTSALLTKKKRRP